MQGTTNIEIIGYDAEPNSRRSRIQRGPLTLPEGANIDGQLIAFGENDGYLHCIVSGNGNYYGVFKSEDQNHLYQRLVELNAK